MRIRLCVCPILSFQQFFGNFSVEKTTDENGTHGKNVILSEVTISCVCLVGNAANESDLPPRKRCSDKQTTEMATKENSKEICWFRSLGNYLSSTQFPLLSNHFQSQGKLSNRDFAACCIVSSLITIDMLDSITELTTFGVICVSSVCDRHWQLRCMQLAHKLSQNYRNRFFSQVVNCASYRWTRQTQSRLRMALDWICVWRRRQRKALEINHVLQIETFLDQLLLRNLNHGNDWNSFSDLFCAAGPVFGLLFSTMYLFKEL